MKKVFILAEGETEEKFVREMLKPYFTERNILLIPIVLKGVSKYLIIKKEIDSLLKDSSAKLVTTMIDLYGSPIDMPQKSNITKIVNCIEKVEFLENALSADVNHPKFLPYLQLHEFEALLFSDVSHFSILSRNISELEKIASQKEPEEINDSPSTAPSKRIIKQIPKYEFSKPTNGIIVAKSIGLEKMREKCPHFDNWLNQIESICNEEC
jgi:hypothetical protein